MTTLNQITPSANNGL